MRSDTQPTPHCMHNLHAESASLPTAVVGYADAHPPTSALILLTTCRLRKPHHSAMQGSTFPLRQFRMRNCKAFDFTWDRGYPGARHRQHTVTDAPHGACPGIRPLEHRRSTDLDLGTDDSGNHIGGLHAVDLAGIDRLFNLHTVCGKAVHDVSRVLAVEVFGARPVVIRGHVNPRTRDGLELEVSIV
jgi:hypothetical protein